MLHKSNEIVSLKALSTIYSPRGRQSLLIIWPAPPRGLGEAGGPPWGPAASLAGYSQAARAGSQLVARLS